MSTPSLDDDSIECYRTAGKIAKEALALARGWAKEGVRLIDLADEVEGLIAKRGARCAFPINICINQNAAHYTPSADDPLRFSRGDLVKLDVGVHVNGYIADTAATVEITTSNWSDLIRASEEALKCAMEMLTPGVSVGALGAAIENAISAHGFKPIRNLTGHSMDRNHLHAGITVPNVPNGSRACLKPGMAVAIEPFATNGIGEVDGNRPGNIYHVIGNRKLADRNANDFLSKIVGDFDHLPFAGRWCSRFSQDSDSLIKKHWRHRNIRSYSILSEKGEGMVSQAEHSSLILEDSVMQYTI